ncbi:MULTISPECIES: beta-N-acetylhexosaminidase [unclassified Oceanispirochaeta]|uniref:beta-N-acetylhexosaminidase n=1 Tax=unclassified Oceanispirochaeta TaxID=2635722 RepID=UPI000E098E28|nr:MULTISPECIES: beta-N-acetylhexosaminidase [unclassified Oceanispirochaeta]MBF9017866.1 beta-N-acetylhexosaminidase [Oceanispirochaeta sp. M2]NPD74377.1 family 20 glycosylhydrolase [Oceanispirochaeta sp. M1]RDG29763.1 beta-N-acetylglucosaminidase [Oceanispirochaeta sp. M1]
MKNKINIVPLPRIIEELQGSFIIENKTVVNISPEVSALLMIPAAEEMGREEGSEIILKEGCSSLADLIEGWIEPLRLKVDKLLPIAVKKSKENIIILEMTSSSDSNNSPESYEMKVEKERIVISASRAAGFFYAIQSLIQGIDDSGEIEACRIKDKPRFPWRGLHLDCGRFFQPLDEIKLFLDYMALHKMNIFHWHLTEDQGWRLEIKQYPLLTEIGSQRKETVWGHVTLGGKEDDKVPHGGFYSHEDVRGIVSYARNRGIMVVPEIDLPGHSRAAIAAYPELGVFGRKMDVFTKWGVCKDIYSPEESTISFLENVMKEVLELFPSPWIHIGGDEAVKDQWKQSGRVRELLKERGLKDNHEMQSWFIKKIASILKDKGRKIIGWDEIMEGGAPEDAVIMAWRHEKQGIAAAGQGLPVLMCPCQWTYLDYREKRSPFEPLTISTVNEPFKEANLKHFYSWNPLPPVLNEEEKKLIMGGQGQIWTEYMPGSSMLQYMTWPRASALAEVLWSPAEKRDFTDFTKRLSPVLSLMDRRGLVYHFQGELIEGGTLDPVENEWQEQSFSINQEGKTGRLQILLKRKGFSNYSQISEICLETAEGRLFKDVHEGYTGKFNRLNVYTLGNGTAFDLKGCRLTIRSRACSQIPGKDGSKIKTSRLQWSFRKS